MNTSDGNYIGYLLATLRTLDVFSTSKTVTSKSAHQAKIQAIIATIGISWLKTLKEWEAKKKWRLV
jgi:anaerobic C4-dicarboxylate transporter